MPNANFIYEYDFWQQTMAGANIHTHIIQIEEEKNTPKNIFGLTNSYKWQD